MMENNENGNGNSKDEKLFARYATYFIEGKMEVPKDIEILMKYNRSLKKVEGEVEKDVHGIISQYDIYTKYLQHIRGIGPMFAANLIAMIDPPERFAKPSALTAFAGMTGEHYEAECASKHKIIYASVPKTGLCNVMITNDEGESFGEQREPCGAKIVRITKVVGAPRRKKGYVLMINGHLKTLMFKIANSFEKQPTTKSFYRALYVQWKEEALAKLDLKEKGYKMHARLRAIRKMSHRFLVDLHVNWMHGLGYDVTPYESTLPNHTMAEMHLDDGTHLPGKGSIAPIDKNQQWQIKQTVGMYYDTQKLRIASFNNIVAWCKQHRNDLPDFPENLKKQEDDDDNEDE